MMGKKGEYGESKVLARMEPGNPVPGWLNTDKDCEEQLDPCPHCGGKDLKIIYNEVCFYVKCSCGCIGPKGDTRQLAYIKWNLRSPWSQCYFCGNDEINGYFKKQGGHEAYCPDCRASYVEVI